MFGPPPPPRLEKETLVVLQHDMGPSLPSPFSLSLSCLSSLAWHPPPLLPPLSETGLRKEAAAGSAIEAERLLRGRGRRGKGRRKRKGRTGIQDRGEKKRGRGVLRRGGTLVQERVRAPISPPGQKKKGRRKNGRIILSSLQVLPGWGGKERETDAQFEKGHFSPLLFPNYRLFPVQSEGTPFFRLSFSRDSSVCSLDRIFKKRHF